MFPLLGGSPHTEPLKGSGDGYAPPCFKNRASISAGGGHPWLEIIYTGSELISDLRDRVEALTAGADMEVLRIKNARIMERALERDGDADTLDTLDLYEVFERCLAAHGVPDEQRPDLRLAYRETVASFLEEDPHA